MSDPGKAVFLSYASQDAEAAKRICDALRTAGVEVWFDAVGGLEHGDEWDAKIRRQIKECVLFLPIISANTQAREEGYFRLEWDLAVERARTIASGVAFILPVVIDDTKEPVALVPDRFRTVQWTRLPGGTVPADVLQRFLKLWSHRRGLLKHAETVGEALRPDEESGRKALPTIKPSSRWLAPVIAGGVIAVLALILARPWEKASPPVEPSARRSAPTTAETTAPHSEARQLVARAWEQMNKPGLARAELETADELCKRAAALDPLDAEVWAAWSQVDSWYLYNNLDSAPARRESARTKAAQALQLAPGSYEAGLAQACYLIRGGGGAGGGQSASLFAAEAESLLRTLLLKKSDEPRALLALGILLRNTGKFAEVREVFGRMAKSPAFAAQAWNELGWAEYLNSEYRAAEIAADASIALQPYGANLTLKGWIAQRWRGDLDQAKATLERIPVAVQQEDYGVSWAAELFYFRRDPENMLRVLNNAPREWLHSNGFDGPKAYWAALAHRMAGHGEAAQVQWRKALNLVERRLADQPDSGFLLHWKGLLLAAAGDRAEGGTVLRLARDMGNRNSTLGDATDQVLLGNLDAALTLLEKAVAERSRFATVAIYSLNPVWDPLREQPRFKALLEKMEADPRFSPKAVPAPSSFLPSPSAQPAPDAKSVAVLPFANLSGDKDQEYFSDGLTEEILNALARERDLRVPGRSSSFSFKGKNASAAEIAKALNVSRLVEGSVRKSGNKVRISVSLTRASDGFSEELGTFTEELTDIFALQDKVARIVVEKLTQRAGTKAVAALTNNPEAYDAYLRGRALQTRAAAYRYEAAVEYERAVAADPQFALAWARLAEARFRDYRAFFDWRPAIVEATRTAIDRALVARPDLPEALIARAEWHRLVTCDYAAAQRDLDRAEALQPATSDLRHAQGLLALDRGDEALAKQHLRAAMQMDPENGDRANSIGNAFNTLGELQAADELYARAMRIQGPGRLIPVYNRVNLRARWRGPEAALRLLDRAPAGQRGIDELATSLLLQVGRDAEAAARARRISIDQFAPGDFQIFQDAEAIAHLLTVAGDTNRARALWQQLREAAGKEIAAGDLAPRIRKTLVRAEAALGQRGAAQAALEEWRKSAAAIPSANRRLVEFERHAVACYADLGMKDEAIALLREIENSTYGYGFSLRGAPSFRPLHGDPRFEELVRRAEAAAKAQPDPVEP